ncbi:lysine N(6)-hydroxylase/L-ornithine N(5)-oxygenase family protein [Streptomyces sp. NPDC053048]|uniref:lysine N(6)-hydroxylase/L-ornithine N(5)-oxygenase family protein n=1 Tax=Streptomyces sp. NPDC053048 TaxID=3365694 RepID=UPI0037CE0F9A
MRHEDSPRSEGHYRCVGVGAGPANLSLASLLHERPQVRNLFIDRKESFGWHDEQQIPGTTLQVSLFKDLVSLSEPTNPFSFLSYLHDKGRIYHFLNAQFSEVPRQEFRNYLAWAAERNKNVAFGEEVVEVGFDGVFRVRTDRRTVTADNIVVGVGSRPWVPDHGLRHLGATQFHVNEYLARAGNLGGKRVVVVGGGQSGAEAVLDLLSRSGAELPRRVAWISRRRNFFPIDDSPFTNDFYTPSHSDYFYNLPADLRSAFNARHVLSSDGISESTLREVYQRVYVLRFVEGRSDVVGLYPNREVADVTRSGPGTWDLEIRHNDGPADGVHFDADVIIWATGFRPAAMDFLAPLDGRLEREGDELRIDEHFAVQWDGPNDHNIFVQNAARQQRGLPDPNLSLNAWRSRRIADRLCGTRTGDQLASFVAWSAKEESEVSWENR